MSCALAQAPLELLGRIPHASNEAHLCLLTLPTGAVRRAVYKPLRGERPLSDFPAGTLARRETAAYLLSRELGLDIVPPTVLRDDAPLGPGSVQAYVLAHDPRHQPIDLFAADDVPADTVPVLRAYDTEGDEVVLAHTRDPRLLEIAVFDAVANNADRKASHVLFGAWDLKAAPGLWAVDNALSFNVHEKLRTVLWGFAGQPVPAHLRTPLAALAAEVPPHIAQLLGPAEVAALAARCAALVERGTLPWPPRTRAALPWPPL